MTDLFNWMTVLVLLPLEMVTGFLAGLSELLVDLILTDHQTSSNHLSSSNPLSFLDAILDPLVDSIVILNQKFVGVGAWHGHPVNEAPLRSHVALRL